MDSPTTRQSIFLHAESAGFLVRPAVLCADQRLVDAEPTDSLCDALGVAGVEGHGPARLLSILCEHPDVAEVFGGDELGAMLEAF